MTGISSRSGDGELQASTTGSPIGGPDRIPPEVGSEPIRRAVESERRKALGTAAMVRAYGGAALFFIVLGCWLATRADHWLVYLWPLALYTAAAGAVFILHRQTQTQLLTWACATLDVGAIYY